MKFRAPLVAFVMLAVFIAGGGTASRPAHAQPADCPTCIDGQAMASESYYRMDVPNGTMSVRVEAIVEFNGRDDPTVVQLFALSSGTNHVIRLKDSDAALPITIEPGSEADADGRASIVSATLPKPVRSGNRIKVAMTYDIPPHNSELVKMEPGAIEAVFASQGFGSFVLIELPRDGDNYLDPGCLLATDQPSDLRDAGLERWVCGEVTIAAFTKDDPSTQRACASMADKCRQKVVETPFSAFAQSVTNPDLFAQHQADLVMPDGRSVRLLLKYFRRDKVWADRQFEVATKAFPRLEAIFGFNYPYDTVRIRESHHIEIFGALGISYASGGDVLVSPSNGIDDEVTVHELAHQWAGSTFIRESWLAEGLAQWAAATLAPELGYTPYNRNWQRITTETRLAEWGTVNFGADFWYGKAGAFMVEVQKAVGGPEVFTRALGLADDDAARLPHKGRWLLDAAEEASSANLDELFLQWAFVPETAAPLLAERRAAHDLVKSATARAATHGLVGTPADIRLNLNDWAFRGIAVQATDAQRTIDEYLAVLELSTTAGLPVSSAVAASWGTQPLPATRALIDSQRSAIQAIVDAAARLATQPEDPVAASQLEKAREQYAAGKFDDARRLAAGSTTVAYNKDASERVIALAKDTQSKWKPEFLEKVGLLLADPAADLAAAEQAFGSGDYDAALTKARAAQEGWDGARRTGLMLLASSCGAMALLSAIAVWLLRRIDGRRNPSFASNEGHALLPSDERRPTWKDWENSGR